MAIDPQDGSPIPRRRRKESTVTLNGFLSSFCSCRRTTIKSHQEASKSSEDTASTTDDSASDDSSCDVPCNVPCSDAVLQSGLKTLEDKCPEAYPSERLRFLKSKKGNVAVAMKQLEEYLEWNTQQQSLKQEVLSQQKDEVSAKLNTPAVNLDEKDRLDWEMAAEIARRIHGVACSQKRIPRCIQLLPKDNQSYWTDPEGHAVVQLTPGMMDERIMPLKTYALAIAFYVNFKLPRDSFDTITLLIDARTGQGWRNLSAGKVLGSFVRPVIQLLVSRFPNRLYRAIVFPIPRTLHFMWKTVSKYMDPLTARKVCLISGPAKLTSPQPTAQLQAQLDTELVALLEQTRIANFQ